MPTTTRIAGIDGCHSGWVVATAVLENNALGPISCRIVNKLAPLFEFPRPLDLAAIDIPIGLPDTPIKGGRRADTLARKALKAKSSSVFSPPPRCVLDADDFEHARRLARTASKGKLSITIQTWNLVPKIKETDTLARKVGQGALRECHPELTFARILGSPIKAPKRTPDGQVQRLGALRDVGIEISPRAFDHAETKKARRDDIIDAHACLYTAQRMARDIAERVPDPPDTDSTGLRMEIWA